MKFGFHNGESPVFVHRGSCLRCQGHVSRQESCAKDPYHPGPLSSKRRFPRSCHAADVLYLASFTAPNPHSLDTFLFHFSLAAVPLHACHLQLLPSRV
ncbi:hypothetical protein PAXRUDRAFT_739271 [Paxillus rubicundulus Ve08.2h10]|uniref:Uncharacterized protein n=1 Tax=Paxillus rubicundulus Ve08.2h10 TaxID=930991 RepID=A0A0D0D1E4_9AGAM|nr:hypothetical protein PAXRUDRAFT_739271 [Paxillus rubicundulus Ve08.2h10]